MTKIEHILFPYDFSHPCALVEPFVGTVACRFGAKITLLAVIPSVWDRKPTDFPVLTGAAAPQEELEAHLGRAAATLFPGVEVQTVATMGDASYKIVEFARNNHVDLIMMPTHGLGTFRTVLIGSVTAKVLHNSKCPVWTAAHSESQASPLVPRNILCALDRTAETIKVMQWAAAFSQKMGATLNLLHVAPSISDCVSLPSERRLQEEVRNEAIVQMESLRTAAGVDAPLRVAVGKLTETVTEEARREQADLVVIGRGTLPNALGPINSHAYGIIQQSPCPVLSV